MPLLKLFDKIMAEWNIEDTMRMKQIAHNYAERRWMDGSVIKKTGEVIPRDSA
jgi:hypothetical protein